MHLAVYHPWIHTRGGAERVILEIARKSSHDVTIYTNKYVPDNTFEEFQDQDIKVIGNIPVVGEVLRGASFAIGALLSKVSSDHDALLVSTGGIGEIVNFRNRKLPTIGFCHTPLRIANDEQIRQRKMEEAGVLKKMFLRTAIAAYKIIEKPAWKLFDHVIFNSENSRERALENRLINRDKTSIINPGVEIEGKKSENYEKYFFYPSRFADYKRQDLAIEAYREFRERNPETDYRLLIAGGVNQEKEDYYEEIEQKADQIDGVEVMKNVSPDEWEDLYSNCFAVLFCAVNEDWGIIPLEAGAYEKPVISVNEGGPRESVLHSETGFLVDAEPEEFADKMGYLVENPEEAREMGDRNRENAENYTWENFVERIDREVEEQA
jgi:glycosyltransferase involved in cell wall biosynthesis